jgi:hypothetical protein
MANTQKLQAAQAENQRQMEAYAAAGDRAVNGGRWSTAAAEYTGACCLAMGMANVWEALGRRDLENTCRGFQGQYARLAGEMKMAELGVR